MTPIEKALEILPLTKDGDDLTPEDLKILEMAVNGYLNEEGYKYFDQLHYRVTKGLYDKMKIYLHGVEHITKDNEGYIYFKGKHVEHYSHRDWKEEQFDAVRLAKLCELLEKKGYPVNNLTVVWKVEQLLTQEELESVGYFEEYKKI